MSDVEVTGTGTGEGAGAGEVEIVGEVEVGVAIGVAGEERVAVAVGAETKIGSVVVVETGAVKIGSLGMESGLIALVLVMASVGGVVGNDVDVDDVDDVEYVAMGAVEALVEVDEISVAPLTLVKGLVESRGDVEEVIGVRLKVLGSDVTGCDVVDCVLEVGVAVMPVEPVLRAFQKVELNKLATEPSLPTIATCKLGIMTNSLALRATPKTCTISPSASATFAVKPRATAPLSIRGEVLGSRL